MKETPYGAVRRLVDLPPDELVRVYSYQGRDAWNLAETRGYWTGVADYIEGEDHDWSDPYRWMREAMAKRIPGFSGDYPMWAWLKRPSTKPKPRRYRGTAATIRLTAMIPRRRILISDYETWHTVLNSGFMCETEAEWDAFYAQWPLHHSMGDADYERRYFKAITPSWDRVLEFRPTSDPEIRRWTGGSDRFRLQACIDRIEWSEIIAVREFK